MLESLGNLGLRIYGYVLRLGDFQGLKSPIDPLGYIRYLKDSGVSGRGGLRTRRTGFVEHLQVCLMTLNPKPPKP